MAVLINRCVLFHGGNLDDFSYSGVIPKRNRIYGGVGLYLTSNKDVARVRYAKGNRKLYSVTVDLNEKNDIARVTLTLAEAVAFIKSYVKVRLRKELSERITYYSKKFGGNKIPAYIFYNTMLNEDALSMKNFNTLRMFLVEKGAYYEISGGNESVTVVFNMNIVKNISRI